ncbi:hypothetical protein KM043_002631 [Ampulex compressa]|nr:hypothetical protein KM043_002631 [Ampulex compressa]
MPRFVPKLRRLPSKPRSSAPEKEEKGSKTGSSFRRLNSSFDAHREHLSEVRQAGRGNARWKVPGVTRSRPSAHHAIKVSAQSEISVHDNGRTPSSGEGARAEAKLERRRRARRRGIKSTSSRKAATVIQIKRHARPATGACAPADK